MQGSNSVNSKPFFATCGDDRALEVALKAGFEATRHQDLIVNFHKPMPGRRKEALTDEIHQLGPF